MTQTGGAGRERALRWGRKYAMVRPDHFRVGYQINPYMDISVQPEPKLARRQWGQLAATISRAGGSVVALGQREDSPDMVYAMNLGLALRCDSGARVALSHMRYVERRLEAATAARWFEAEGYHPFRVGQAGVGAHFEAGDAFPFAGRLVVGFGPRTEKLALKHLASEFEIDVVGVQITHPGMYHLDLAFCPLDARAALVCPAAFDRSSADALLALVPDPIVVTEEEALTFCVNSIVVGQTVIMPACPDRVRVALHERGFQVVLVGVTEFHKGGGSVRCLTNPLDIVVGRDLRVTVGRVRLPLDEAS